MIRFVSRFRLLTGLFLMSMKLSFDLSLHQSTKNIQAAWNQAAEEKTIESLFTVVDEVADTVVTGGADVVSDGRDRIRESASEVYKAARNAVDSNPPSSKYAYAFVIGGCNIEDQRYRGFLYNIIVSTRILREEGSTADVVAYFQISYKSASNTLPHEDVRLLRALNIRIKYIPKSELESFYETCMNKFRILTLTEYRRVLLLDGDVMPVANLDYLFALSDTGTLKENVVVAGQMEPANGGFFMLAPAEGEFERIQEIIRKREESAVAITDGHKFDEVNGWGHRIEPPDQWKTRRFTGTNWTFHGAFVDQGLLYHYTKYVLQSVSIIYAKNEVENYRAVNGIAQLEETLNNPFAGLSLPRIRDPTACVQFICDYIHFGGKHKPWMNDPLEIIANPASKEPYHQAQYVWWQTLYKLNEELDMSLDFTRWNVKQSPTLGLYAKFGEMDRRVNLRGSSTLSDPKSEGLPILPAIQEKSTSMVTQTDSFEASKYAYAFVIGGCDPENGQYKGFLYNVLVSARVLRQEGAKADIVAFFQMSYSSEATELPEEDKRALAAMGIKVFYIPKSEMEGFYDTVMNKFRILSLTQYRRVLLMDGDVMPLSNLDYLFKLSDGEDAILKENIVVTGPFEPANAGFFVLAPREGAYEEILEIIRIREEKAKNIDEWEKFDVEEGWGHVIEEPDMWRAKRKRGRQWDFHFAYSDQGLLYHYTKYVRKSVSIITGFASSKVWNFGKGADGKVAVENELTEPFVGHSKPRVKSYSMCNKFICDYYHFTGFKKPWMIGPPENYSSKEHENDGPEHIWWYSLFELNEKLQMGLDFANWEKDIKPPLGMYAKFAEVDRRVKQRSSTTHNKGA